MRVVVMVDVISPRVGRHRLLQKTFFRYLERGFAPWAVCLATVSKTPEKLFIPHESLLPGTVLQPTDPQSWAQPFSPWLWTYSGTWPLGLKPSCFPSNHCSWWHLVPTKPIPWPLCHFPHYCISNGTAARSLRSQPQTLDVPSVPQAIIEVSSDGHWVGQLTSHTAPSGAPKVPVWLMGTLQCK